MSRTRYEFRGPGLRVQVVDPAIEGGIGVRLEHASGAALIVPSVEPEPDPEGVRVRIVGFDGTRFELRIREDHAQVFVRASVKTPILGGEDTATATRAPEHEVATGPVRVTGDEATMPIAVDDD